MCARLGSTYTKIGTIQRRLAWPLCKDDTQIREAFHIFYPWLIHVSVWQKPLQYCKVISLQLIKINGKKRLKFTKLTKTSEKKINKHNQVYLYYEGKYINLIFKKVNKV